MNQSSQSNKPKPVETGIALLWYSLFLDPFKLVLFPFDGHSKSIFITNYFTSALIVFPILIFVLVMVTKGKNWARITLTIMCIVGFFMLIPKWTSTFAIAPAMSLYEIVLSLAQAIALILLFTQPANNYFTKTLSHA